ncbi:hypothetical protein [Anaerotignum lactatifermentans]|uniref:hypothetical protein n=1 Tax=Anaerotignum lactatifermentans TaxID=160404 RepID=UPI003AB1D284
MTREEAIAFLIQYTDNECYTEKCQEAHRMAISALRSVSREQVGSRGRAVSIVKSTKSTLCELK